jgi:hypothetical protein
LRRTLKTGPKINPTCPQFAGTESRLEWYGIIYYIVHLGFGKINSTESIDLA